MSPQAGVERLSYYVVTSFDDDDPLRTVYEQ